MAHGSVSGRERRTCTNRSISDVWRCIPTFCHVERDDPDEKDWIQHDPVNDTGARPRGLHPDGVRWHCLRLLFFMSDISANSYELDSSSRWSSGAITFTGGGSDGSDIAPERYDCNPC